MENINCKKILLVSIALLTSLASLCVPLSSVASDNKAGQPKVELLDRNKDGEPDLIRHVMIIDESGSRPPVTYMVEEDTNSDTRMDTFTYRPDGRLVKIEKDSDFNRKIDTKIYFFKDQVVRKERYDKKGQLTMVVDYDDEGYPSQQRVDTNGDGRFNLVISFIDGKRSTSTEDTNNDGKVDLWERYENDKLVEKTWDENGDGLPDSITWFDAEGRPLIRSLDKNGDGVMDTFQSYVKGKLSEERLDKDQDGRNETITSARDPVWVLQRKDTNSDGIFDDFNTFKNNILVFQKADTNFDGVIDRLSFYDDKGFLKEIRDDSGHTGHFDQFRYFKRSSRPYLLVRDKNRDGKPDIRVYFNSEGKRTKVETDSNLDGRFDTWETYGSQGLARIEKDEDENGKVDFVGIYDAGKLVKSMEDKNGDGRFEITKWFNRPGWYMVMELDADQDGHPEERSYFKAAQMKTKATDKNSGSRAGRSNADKETGRLVKVEKYDESTGKINLTMYYNSDEKLIRAEKDTNLDGKTDVWFHYNNGVLSSVEQDTNLDGRPDIWETYDKSGKLIQRKKDLDFDGTPDIIEDGRHDSNPSK